MQRNPYIFGRAVKGDEFINRENELRSILNRVCNRESTTIVGEPHIGKTSLLLKITAQETLLNFFGEEAAKKIIPNYFSLHDIPADYTPQKFWLTAVEPISKCVDCKIIKSHLREAKRKGFGKSELRGLFRSLEAEGWLLMLALDEFERLLTHQNFQDPSFFAGLRGLASVEGGLAILPASRMSVAEMNRRGRGLLDTGSPFFNNTIEERLEPFDESSIYNLLQRQGNGFTKAERAFIHRVAGPAPFLLQAMAGTLWETRGAERQTRAAEKMSRRIAHHFDDLWVAMDATERTVAIILTLLAFSGKAFGQNFNYGEIERNDRYERELCRLEDRGFARRVAGKDGWQFDREHLLVWRGEKWTVASLAFAWWVRDVVLAEARNLPAYDEWLKRKKYRGFLTQEQWGFLKQSVTQLPVWAVRGAGSLAHELWLSLTHTNP